MSAKRYKRNYRWLIPPLLIIAILILGAYVVVDALFSDNIQGERIPLPSVKRVSLAALREDTAYTWDDTLMLINAAYPLPEEYTPLLTEYKDSGLSMSLAIAKSYEALSDAVEQNANDDLYISSAARTHAEQEAVYADDPTVAAKPGQSEHEAGLALDLYVSGHAGKEFLDSKAGKYVNEHCTEYGFIIRYPRFAKAITGIGFEPWHVRYVGVAHSTRMETYDLTLEEYIDSLQIGEFYRSNGYIISRQKPQEETLLIPTECTKLHISPDNTGCYIITGICKEDTL